MRALLALLLLVAAPAAAQWKTSGDTLGGPVFAETPSGDVPVAQRRLFFVYSYGRCLADHERDRVAGLARLVPGTAAFAKASTALLEKSRCVVEGGELKIDNDDELAGALFQGQYLRRFSRTAPNALNSVPTDYLAVAGGERNAVNLQYAATRQFGECVVRRNPAGSHAFLLTRVGTARQGEAIAALTPALSACLNAGQSFSISPGLLRAVVAEAAWRLSSPVPAGAKG